MNVVATARPEDQQNLLAHSLRSRARDFVPKLRERALQCEADRRVPEETIADLLAAGLLRLSQPARYHGHELGWNVLCEIARILASGCGSQAWIQFIYNDHAHMISSSFSAEAQHDVWNDNHDAFVSASVDPVGRAHRVDGGFKFSGRHAFSSGIDYASWLICGGYIVEQDRLDGPHFFLIPKRDVVVIDDWYTIGLEGTGSKSFIVDDTFVPMHRWVDGGPAHHGSTSGTAVNKSYVYRLPRGAGTTSTGFASLAVGMAQGVLQEWLTVTGPRKSRGVSVGGLQSTQLVAAECAAEIAAAEALCSATLRTIMHKLAHGEEIDLMDRINGKRNVAFANQLVLKAGTRLFNAAGGRALFRQNALQRQYRNLLGATSHHALVWESAATEVGAALLEPYRASVVVGEHSG